MRSHNEIKQMLSAYSCGDLSSAEKAWVEEHLSSCRSCRAELDELKTALKLSRNNPDYRPPINLTTRIMTNIVEKPERQDGLVEWFFSLQKTGFALTIIILLTILAAGLYLIKDYDFERIKAFTHRLHPQQSSVSKTTPSAKEKSENTASPTTAPAKSETITKPTETILPSKTVLNPYTSNPAKQQKLP